MGQGGTILLVNNTSDKWKKINAHSYQMEHWEHNFPDELEPYTSVLVYVEFREGLFITSADDSGLAQYALDKTDFLLTMSASGRNGFHLQYESNFPVLETPQYPEQQIPINQNMGWNWNKKNLSPVVFGLSKNNQQYYYGLCASKWMERGLQELGSKGLGQICMPGSHDAGMSVCRSPTFGATVRNTITQVHDIGEQLCHGVRYFDIRPVIGGGEYYTGHYSIINLGVGVRAEKVSEEYAAPNIVGYEQIARDVNGLVHSPQELHTAQGARGQSIQSLINNINSFTQNNNELIILDLSHSLNTDLGNASYRSFNQNEWDKLFQLLSSINYLFKTQVPDLTCLTLNDFINPNGYKKSAVIILVNDENIDLKCYARQGFYKASQVYKIINEYADSNDVRHMAQDQLNKLAKAKQDNSCFLLSWTLTQSIANALSPLQIHSILALAEKANAHLLEYNLPQKSTLIGYFPHIILVDKIADASVLSVAQAINRQTTLLHSNSCNGSERIHRRNSFFDFSYKKQDAHLVDMLTEEEELIGCTNRSARD